MGNARKRVSPAVASQVNRDLDNLMVRCIVGVVKELDPPWERNTFGRPRWNPRLVAVSCFIKVFFARSYEGTEAYLRSNDTIRRLLHGAALPGHSVIARGMDQMSITYIRKVSRHLTLRMRRQGMDVIADSTGFSLKTSSKWFDIRIRSISTKKDHIKLHVVIDAETLVILHFTITGWKGSDTREFKRLIRDLPRLGKGVGDKAYASRANCQAVADKGGTPFLCFRSNATGTAKGSPAWKVSFRAYSDDPDEWLSGYHIRSVVESVFASIKKCWGPDIRSRKGWHKRRELSMKVVAYNIKRALYVERAEALDVPLYVHVS